jgi:hypothetical protein
LLLSPFGFGFSQQGSIDGLSLAAGLAGLFALLVVVTGIIKQITLGKNLPKINSPLVLLALLSLLSLVFQLAFTQPVWSILPFAQFIQFPWRLSLFFAIGSAALVGYVVEKIQNKTIHMILLSLLFIQLVSLYNAKAVDYFSKNIIDYDLFSQSTSTLNENLPKNFTYQSFAASWSPQPSVLDDLPAQITVISWTGTKRTYTVTTDQPITIIEPTMLFAGWETTITQGETHTKTTYVDSDQIGGRLAYQLEPGTHNVTTRFTQHTLPRLIGNTVSLVSLLFVVGYLTKEIRPLLLQKHEK